MVGEGINQNFKKALSFLMPKLETELSPHLHYHNAEHTKDVLKSVQSIAEVEGIPEQERELLYTAALFHDAGFLENNHNGHEEKSCELAWRYLFDLEYSEAQIVEIVDMIRATKLPQSPKNIYEKILCDGDLYYLGGDDYFKYAECLYREWKHYGVIKDREEWRNIQIDFLKNQNFHTDAALTNLNDNKKKVLLQLQNTKNIKQSRKKPAGWLQTLQDSCSIIIGVVIAGFALKGFLVPNHFIDGGVTGISLLLSQIYGLNLSLLNLFLNIPFVVASYFIVNKKFAFKTLVCVALLSICLQYLPYPIITTDKLLISIFGGFFLGLGAGLVMRAGSALDGIEVLALYTFKRTSFRISEIILAINILMFSIAAIALGVEAALYSILTYFTATKSIDYVVEGIQAYTGVTIISGKSEFIKQRLVNELGRGLTIYKGERGFLPDNYDLSYPCDIIFTVVTRLELRKLKNLVYDADPKAFVFANTIREAAGGILHRQEHH